MAPKHLLHVVAQTSLAVSEQHQDRYPQAMQRQVIATDKAPGAIGPYSQAIKAEGKFLFMSGQIPLKPDGTMVQASIKGQAQQVVDNMKAVLAAAGLTPSNLVKTTIFLSSMDHFSEVNEVYGAMFAKDPPARSTVAVAALPKGADVEIEGIAVY